VPHRLERPLGNARNQNGEAHRQHGAVGTVAVVDLPADSLAPVAIEDQVQATTGDLLRSPVHEHQADQAKCDSDRPLVKHPRLSVAGLLVDTQDIAAGSTRSPAR
jgi:hypothetical protein